jgi:catechol 2,3-dioxygenase-like lactoylglutathione lyase family enzyme
MQKYTFAPLVPELVVLDIQKSLRFWCEGLGFRIVYDRPEERFAYLERDALQVMLDQYSHNGRWNVGTMEKPFGRGVNLQMFVTDITPTLESLKQLEWPLFMDVEEKWYRTAYGESGNRQFLVQDPDGYLLRFAQDLGTRPLTPTSA